MKKLVAVLIMLIFLIPFSYGEAEAGKSDKRYKKNSREYNSYERGQKRGHGDSRYYKKYRRQHRERRYVRRDHYRNRHHWGRHRWERHHVRQRDRYRNGEYHYDKNNKLMFSYCQEEGDRRSNKEVCFSISIGD